jgi:hypothetical protein
MLRPRTVASFETSLCAAARTGSLYWALLASLKTSFVKRKQKNKYNFNLASPALRGDATFFEAGAADALVLQEHNARGSEQVGQNAAD